MITPVSINNNKQFFKIEFNAPTTLVFVGLCVFVYILDLLSNKAVTEVFFSAYRSNWIDPMQYIRLFTHVFGHATREHLFNNMIMILLLGPMLEEKHGSKQVAFMMIVTALATGIINLILMDRGIRGASGIVFMFFFAASFSNMRAKGNIPFTFLLAVIAFVIEALFFSTSLKNVSYLAHGVGALCGAVYGWLTEKPGNPIQDLQTEPTETQEKNN